MTGRPARIALWSFVGAVLLATGYLLLNTTFMPYDDEGFVLVSLRNYLGGQRLYDDVFSQYGPWPYVYHQLITTALGGAPMTHTLGRAITLAHWVTLALLCGAIAWRLARSQVAAACTAVLAFGLTWQNTSEPSHPGSHLALLVALAGYLAALLPESARRGRISAALGVITALLLLTKVNVGVFLGAGLGAWLLRTTDWPPRLARAARLASAAVLLLPWVLLGRQLGQPWALTFAVFFTLTGAAVCWLTPRDVAAPGWPVRVWGPGLAGAATALILVTGWVLARGTSGHALVQAVLLDPLRLPARFQVPVTWFPECWLLAAVAAFAAFRAGGELRREGQVRAATARLITVLRLGTLGFILVTLRYWPTYPGMYHFVAYGLPLLPAFLVPLARPADRRAATWGVAWVALPQILHAFPVAGSQLAWSSFLFVPLLVAGVWDAGAWLAEQQIAAAPLLRRATAAACAVGALYLAGLLAQTGWERFRTSRPLDLPGAADVRLDGRTRQALRLLTLNAAIHADVLFTRQGMYSFNLWSGVPTPTAQNATHWFTLLSEPAQRAIIARLAAAPRSAFIVSRPLDDFLRKQNVPVTGPLQDFVEAHYRPLFDYRDFEFRVPRDSTAVAFGRLAVRQADAPTAGWPLLFTANIALDGAPAQIRLERIDHPWTAGPELLGPATQVFAEPIDRAGQARGAAVRLPAAQPLHGLYRLSILAPPLPPRLPWQDYALVVRDGQGGLLAEAVY